MTNQVAAYRAARRRSYLMRAQRATSAADRFLMGEQAKHVNDPRPTNCAECDAELVEADGMVGETVLYCPNGCGVAWEDSEEAIARVV